MNDRTQYGKRRATTQPEEFEVLGIIKRETENAVLVEMQFDKEEIWFPLSQVHSIHREQASLGRDRLLVTPWIAKQKGLY